MFLCILFSVPFLATQNSYTEPDSMRFMPIGDTVPIGVADSIPIDSVKAKKNVLESVVDYSANDSIVLTAGNWGYLYGDGEITYGDIKLKAENISMNMDSSIVNAIYGLDSIGKEFGYPVFSDGGTDYETKTMKYNFKTRKGYSTHLITQQGEGYIVAGKAKKNADNSFFMQDGKYTTCDDHEHPHFYLALTKAKVRPHKNVVTGPAYLVIEDLPLPLGLPFGFFPFSEKYSSGVIMPSYGDELERGFNLRDGGYYFAINDYIDLALTGEIYTKGSWGLNARSNYRKRYKYSGGFDMGYRVTVRGEKDVDRTVAKDFGLNWTHSQDPKANMFRTISASVNFSTSTYDRNNLNTLFSPIATQNTKSSSISLNQRFPNSPWSLTASANVAQRTQDSSVSLTLPNLTVTMSRVTPFKRKYVIGPERWYEKIQMSYTGDLRNSIDTREDKLFSSSFSRDWNKAMKHTIPVSATFSVFNYLNITPFFNYNERWYTNKIYEEWDSDLAMAVPSDTVNSFYRVYDFNSGLSFQTRMYGFYKPLFSKSTTIRHIFTPSVSISYAPDFSDPRFGFYERFKYYDRSGNLQPYVYSPFRRGMFGTAPQGAQGLVSFQFENNLEMKVASASDSTGFKKISLIDNLGIGFSHNMMADSLKWSDITTSIRLKLSKTLVINIGAVFDPYMYRLDGNGRPTKVDELRIANGRGIGRLRSTGYAISPSINQDTFKKWFGKSDGKDKSKKSQANDNTITEGADMENPDGAQEKKSMFDQKKDDGEYDSDGYLKNEIKWNLALNFSMNYSYDMSKHSDEDKNGFVEYKGKINKNFGFSGSIQPTKNWNINLSGNYDFEGKAISYMSCNITRNLHCWALTASIIPIGQFQSYYISLRANSSMLQDLKYEQRARASSFDPNWD